MAQEIVKQAVTERGTTLRHTEQEVDLALNLLAINGGRYRETCEQLAEQNVQVSRPTLEGWRTRCFPHRYSQIRHDLGQEISEDMAGRALERALQADEVGKEYIELARAKKDEVDPNHLAKSAQALANVMSQNVEKAQLLRNQPTSIVDIDLDASIALLERMGVAERVDEGPIEGRLIQS